MTVFDDNQKKIALQTLTYNKTAASVMGQTHNEAVEVLRKLGMSDAMIRRKLREAGHGVKDIAEFMALPVGSDGH